MSTNGLPTSEQVAEAVKTVLTEQSIVKAVCDELGVAPEDESRVLGSIVLHLSKRQNGTQQAEAPTPVKVQFVGAADLRASTPPEPAWLWDGYIARGVLTLIAGKPKGGKSTLVAALVEALDASAETFLGRRITACPVVYISEEAAITFNSRLGEASNRVSVLVRENAWPRPAWPALVETAIAEAKRIDAKMLVIDSYVFWSQLSEGQENDSAVNQTMLAKLVAAANAGLAVVLIHHHRKSGGEDGDAVRGSGGIFAAVDALIEVERVKGDSPTAQRQRAIYATGRFANTPAATVVEWDPATRSWTVIGEADSRRELHERTRRDGVRQAVLNAVPWSGAGLPIKEIVAAIQATTDYTEREVETELRLALDVDVQRTGKGVAGSPHMYTRKVPR